MTGGDQLTADTVETRRRGYGQADSASLLRAWVEQPFFETLLRLINTGSAV